MNCIADQPSATAIMTDATPLPFDLPSVERKKLTVDFAGGNQSSNGGLLLRQAERKLGVCGRLADAMPDRRDASRIRHDMGTEVRTVIKHVTKRLRRHWRKTRIIWRGDSHYGRVEAMDWAEDNDADYIFGLAGNAVLDALVAEAADNLRFHHAMSSKAKLRTFASFMYRASSWKRPRKVVARLECSLQPVAGETGMRQEVDIRYVVTSLKGSAQHLYENVYCQRGQMENLIKLHKAQLASDRMSCHSATANQVRLVLHTAAFWLMHGVRAAIPRTNPFAKRVAQRVAPHRSSRTDRWRASAQ